MDLFEYMRENNKNTESPLAMRLRPETLDEMVGQSHIIGKDKLLYRAIKADKLSSVIFYGPPGTGKTTLARIIANTTSEEDYLTNLYDFLEEFDERYNQSVSTDSIIDLCQLARN